MKREETPSVEAVENTPGTSPGGELAMARNTVSQAPLVAAKGLVSDLLAVHAVNLSALTKAITQPGILLDKDNIPHKLLLERISTLQKDILAAGNALVKLEAALTSQNKKPSKIAPNTGLYEGDYPVDVSALVLELAQTQK